MHATTTDGQINNQNDSGVPHRTTRTYRLISRQIRLLERVGTPAADLADLVRVRERAYNTLMTTGHHDIARTLIEEDAFLLRMGACREQGGDPDELRTGLGHVRARMRVLLASEHETAVA